jgi:GntR family transcriptional repressor for pyruvate dehydrogenase complex
MVRIFRGDFPPGGRLPPERHLAVELGTDRTSLRMALKQLSRMNLVTPRHGSGIEVNDYRVHGGLEVLAALFALDQAPVEGSFIVEAIDFWLESFSMTAAKAVVRMSLDELREVERVLDRAIAAGAAGDTETVVACGMEMMDAMARFSGSVFFRMLNNSTRSVRARMMRMLPETVDLTAAFGEQKQMLRNAALQRPGEEQARAAILGALRRLTANLRERLLFAERTPNEEPAKPSGRGDGRRRRHRARERAALRRARRDPPPD